MALACVALVLASGCGADKEKDSGGTESAPLPTVPRVTTPARPDQSTTPAPAQTAPPPGDPGSGGSPAPSTTPRRQDAPSHDTKPPPGSPAERFENFCDANPGACG